MKGVVVVVAREDAPGDNISQLLRSHGAQVRGLGLMRLCPALDEPALLRAASQVADYDCLAFTSANAVSRFLPLLSLAPPRIAAVGEKTAAAVAALGYRADVVGSGGGAALAKALGGRAQRILFPRAEDGRDEFVDAARHLGAQVDVVVAYRQVPLRDAEANARALCTPGAYVVLTSPRRAMLFRSFAIDEVELVAIGKTTSQVLAGQMHHVAAAPSPKGVLDAIEQARRSR